MLRTMSYSYLAFIAVAVALIFPGPTPNRTSEPAAEISQTEDFTEPSNVMEAEKEANGVNYT